MFLQLVSLTRSKIVTARWTLYNFGTLVQMCLSVLIKERCFALLAEELKWIDRILDKSLRWCRVEVLPTFWAILVLFLPLLNARATEESLTVSAYYDIIGNVEADVAFELFCQFSLSGLSSIKALEFLLTPRLPQLLLDLGFNFRYICRCFCHACLQLAVIAFWCKHSYLLLHFLAHRAIW